MQNLYKIYKKNHCSTPLNHNSSFIKTYTGYNSIQRTGRRDLLLPAPSLPSLLLCRQDLSEEDHAQQKQSLFQTLIWQICHKGPNFIPSQRAGPAVLVARKWSPSPRLHACKGWRGTPAPNAAQSAVNIRLEMSSRSQSMPASKFSPV